MAVVVTTHAIVPITTQDMSWVPVCGHAYSIQCMIKLLAVCWWFSLGVLVLSTNKTDHHVTEILLKVMLNIHHGVNVCN